MTQKTVKWYTGWLIVVVSALITCVSVGTRFSTGPFFKPIMADLAFSRESLSLIVAVSLLLYGVGMPLAGALVDRIGTRNVLIFGAFLVSGSMVWTAMSQTALHFFIAFGLLLSFGLAFTSQVALTPVVSKWFSRRRGLALTILISGAMAGIGIMTPVSTWLIQMTGWRTSFMLLAAVLFLLIVPSALFIIRDEVPEAWKAYEQDTRMTKKTFSPTSIEQWTTALGTLPFWQLAIGMFVCGFSMNLLGAHGVPMLTDHGFSEMEASMGIGLIGIVAIGSSIVIGILSDHLPRKNILGTIYLVRGIGFFMLLMATSPFSLYATGLIAGLVWAGSTSMTSAILGDIYGIKWVGTLYGLVYLSHQIGAAIGSYLGGWGYETFHTHWVAFGTAGVLLFIASFVSYTIPTAARWQRQAPTVQKANV